MPFSFSGIVSLYRSEPKEPTLFDSVSGTEIQNLCIGRNLAQWLLLLSPVLGKYKYLHLGDTMRVIIVSASFSTLLDSWFVRDKSHLGHRQKVHFVRASSPSLGEKEQH